MLRRKVESGNLDVRNVYNIELVTGANNPEFRFLSCTHQGKVDLWNCDDGSGRQQWVLKRETADPADVKTKGKAGAKADSEAEGIKAGMYHITTIGTDLTYPDRTFLSCSASGAVDLWERDDGSGRQKWYVNLDVGSLMSTDSVVSAVSAVSEDDKAAAGAGVAEGARGEGGGAVPKRGKLKKRSSSLSAIRPFKGGRGKEKAGKGAKENGDGALEEQGEGIVEIEAEAAVQVEEEAKPEVEVKPVVEAKAGATEVKAKRDGGGEKKEEKKEEKGAGAGAGAGVKVKVKTAELEAKLGSQEPRPAAPADGNGPAAEVQPPSATPPPPPPPKDPTPPSGTSDVASPKQKNAKGPKGAKNINISKAALKGPNSPKGGPKAGGALPTKGTTGGPSGGSPSRSAGKKPAGGMKSPSRSPKAPKKPASPTAVAPGGNVQ